MLAMVPETGIEPVRPLFTKRRILSPMCLPISPLGRTRVLSNKSGLPRRQPTAFDVIQGSGRLRGCCAMVQRFPPGAGAGGRPNMKPPSTGMSWPVTMQSGSSNQAMALAMCSGWVILPNADALAA